MRADTSLVVGRCTCRPPQETYWITEPSLQWGVADSTVLKHGDTVLPVVLTNREVYANDRRANRALVRAKVEAAVWTMAMVEKSRQLCLPPAVIA